jgi:cob(I)alamin adenosyltransferase
MSIITKQGDNGKTKLISGEEVSKSCARIEASGALDELVSQLGLARSLTGIDRLAKEVRELQTDLFRLGAELSATKAKQVKWLEPTSEKHVKHIEDKIQALESHIELPASFLIPGSTTASAAIEVARAVARRLERRVVTLSELGEYDNPHGLVYLNRISDYLFLLARAVEIELGVDADVKEKRE